jgi:hypothetical protein
MKYLLDTNVFGEIGKDEPHQNVRAWLNLVDDTDLAVSTLTVREVQKGIAKLRQRKPEVAALIADRTSEAFSALGNRLLPVTREIAQLWGELLAESEKHIDDTGIAATARVHGLIVVTRNVDDFAARGVDTLNPFEASAKVKRAPTSKAVTKPTQ